MESNPSPEMLARSKLIMIIIGLKVVVNIFSAFVRGRFGGVPAELEYFRVDV